MIHTYKKIIHVLFYVFAQFSSFAQIDSCSFNVFTNIQYSWEFEYSSDSTIISEIKIFELQKTILKFEEKKIVDTLIDSVKNLVFVLTLKSENSLVIDQYSNNSLVRHYELQERKLVATSPILSVKESILELEFEVSLSKNEDSLVESICFIEIQNDLLNFLNSKKSYPISINNVPQIRFCFSTTIVPLSNDNDSNTTLTLIGLTEFLGNKSIKNFVIQNGKFQP